jgi:hypothetical protein
MQSLSSSFDINKGGQLQFRESRDSEILASGVKKSIQFEEGINDSCVDQLSKRRTLQSITSEQVHLSQEAGREESESPSEA